LVDHLLHTEVGIIDCCDNHHQSFIVWDQALTNSVAKLASWRHLAAAAAAAALLLAAAKRSWPAATRCMTISLIPAL
jgi:hypothetical protein